MTRLLGVFLLVAVLLGTLLASNPAASDPDNLRDIARRQGFYSILTLGVGVVIITGGIDLSIGSVVGLGAVAFGVLMQWGWSPLGAAGLVLAGSIGIGLVHGLLITKLRLQPFLVTLCGLFVYRGLAKQLSASDVGLSTARRSFAGNLAYESQLQALEYVGRTGSIGGVPVVLLLSLVVAGLLALLLHGSVYGRYLYAIGANEQAARYAGIPTDRYKISAYILCSLLAGLGGLLELLQVRTASPPTSGTLYELYAITGAVLGGCSLRGGEGTVIGILLGTAVLPLIKTLLIFLNVRDSVEYTLIGLALLVGTVADELFKRRAARAV
jgi:ribose transport system permease protein